MKATPIHFHEHIVEHFPKVLQDFFNREQQLRNEHFYVDSSNKQYKLYLKRRVDEDYKRFLGM